MAISDLTSGQLESLTQALYAPPPPSLTAPQDEYPLAMLSSSQKFIDQLGRMQKAREESRLQTQAASALNQISPLDPEYDNKVRQVAMQFGPETFASSPVQHILSLTDRQRKQIDDLQEKQQKAAREATLDASFKFLRSADENQLDQFVQQYPDMARELAPTLDKRFEELTKSRTQLSQLPEHLQAGLIEANNVPNPTKVATRLKEFNESFQGPLGKVADLARKRRLVDLAKKWEAVPASDESEAANESRASLVDDITAELGESDLVSDSTIRGILRDASKLAAPPNPYIEQMRLFNEQAAKQKAAAAAAQE
jgi:hypothetical protein